MCGFDGEVLSRPPKRQILTVVLQKCEISAVKHFIEKPVLLNFMDFPMILSMKLNLQPKLQHLHFCSVFVL